jgi:HTH-type transcriptional regulator / antitoxin HipB
MSSNDDNRIQVQPVYDAVDVGRAVRLLRNRRGWSQSALAEWLGVHRVTVSKLERGGTVDLALALRALAVLGATLTIHPRGITVRVGGPDDG